MSLNDVVLKIDTKSLNPGSRIAERAMKSVRSIAPTRSIAASVVSKYCSIRMYPPDLSRSEHTVTLFIPDRSSAGTLNASAPPANEMGRSPLNSSLSSLATFTVIACSARPDMYIVVSSKTSLKFKTSRVLESFTPKVTPIECATRRRRRNIATASS
ncbi:hypothetical protein BMS3Bbin01_00131 [bacterium BMS3Bbin01]|nr:hypothetical protein BMS3Bbin01_00131 [bacterium BMS3Bbin01]